MESNDKNVDQLKYSYTSNWNITLQNHFVFWQYLRRHVVPKTQQLCSIA